MTAPAVPSFKDLRWLSKTENQRAQEQNAEILAPFADRLQYRCGQTKLYSGELSPGCVACCDGRWSCMFITPRCTSSCPACPQDPKTRIQRPPIAEGLSFERADDYADYLQKLGYRCTGLCGGEPFLVYDKLLSFVGTIKERLGDRVYVYAYTNGDLVTEEKLKALDAAGLDEIRFNISARDYDLQRLAIATRACRRVTVEVPAVPEDFEVLRDRLESLESLGVANLNLHQLFTTRFNYETFVERHYTAQFRNSFDQLHLPGVGILESEIAALKIMRHILENDIALPFNYCSQDYKNFYQVRGFKKRPAEQAREELETVTDSGFIRRLSVLDSVTELEGIVDALEERQCAPERWSLDRQAGELQIHESLLEHVDFGRHRLGLTYYVCSPRDDADPPGDLREVALSRDRSVFVERKRVGAFQVATPAGVNRYRALCLERRPGTRVESRLFASKDLESRAGQRPSKRAWANFVAAESWPVE